MIEIEYAVGASAVAVGRAFQTLAGIMEQATQVLLGARCVPCGEAIEDYDRLAMYAGFRPRLLIPDAGRADLVVFAR